MFEFYVLNYDFNARKIEMFNIFWNIYVAEETEKAIKKYLRAPKKYKYTKWRFDKNEDDIYYGFEALCMQIDAIIMHECWSRCEYEIAVGSLFTPEIYSVIQDVENGRIKEEEVYEAMKKYDKNAKHLEKWDCYQQAHANIETIVHDCIRRYKNRKKDS